MGPFEVFGWVDRRHADYPVGHDRRSRQTPRLAGAKMRRQILDWLYVRRWWPWALAMVMTLAAYGSVVWQDFSFWLTPVVDISGKVVEKSPSSVFVHMAGKKLRGAECVYRGIQAFGDRAVGLPVDLNIERRDMPSEAKTKPKGVYDIGTWEVWPTPGVVQIRIYTLHECNSHMVSTEIAKVRP